MRDPRKRYTSGERTKEYVAWTNMIARVHCSTTLRTKWRKGRIYETIEVDQAFTGRTGFDTFYEEVGKAPSPDHQLDRINNDKGYILGNLQWSTVSENNKNRRDSRIITAFGKTQNMVDWSKETGVSASTIYKRLKKGWSAENAVSPKISRDFEL